MELVLDPAVGQETVTWTELESSALGARPLKESCGNASSAAPALAELWAALAPADSPANAASPEQGVIHNARASDKLPHARHFERFRFMASCLSRMCGYRTVYFLDLVQEL